MLLKQTCGEMQRYLFVILTIQYLIGTYPYEVLDGYFHLFRVAPHELSSKK